MYSSGRDVATFLCPEWAMAAPHNAGRDTGWARVWRTTLQPRPKAQRSRPASRGSSSIRETLFFLGEFVSAREHLERSIALYNLQLPRPIVSQGDSGAACLSRGARVLWVLGYSEQALQRSREALALARKLADPQSIAFALYDVCTVHHFRREWQTVREQGEMLITLGQEQAFAFHLASGLVARGLASIEQEQEEEGIALMRQGLAALQGTGATLPWTVWSAPLVEAYRKIGCLEEGMALL